MILECVVATAAIAVVVIIATIIVEGIRRDLRRTETLSELLASNPKLRDLPRESGIAVDQVVDKPARELRAANGRWSAFSSTRFGETVFLDREGFPGVTLNRAELRAVAALLVAMADAMERSP